MDLYATLPPEERKKVLAEKLRLSREGIYMHLSEIVAAGVPLSNPRVPIQLELPLEWNRHVTPEPSSEVSVRCIKAMPYLL